MRKLFQQEDVVLDINLGLKVFQKNNLVIHCHHYNARLQRTIEDNSLINGKEIFRQSVMKVFYAIMGETSAAHDLKRVVREMYPFLGFGKINFDHMDLGYFTSDSSHFVEGWRCGSLKKRGTVCTFTEGYLEAACLHLTQESYDVIEEYCMNEGHDHCKFKMVPSPEKKKTHIHENTLPDLSRQKSASATSNVDEQLIIESIMNMPVYGNSEGLAPAFNVYLAHMPQDIYNLFFGEYILRMAKMGLEKLAAKLLIEDAEYCALNTFHGIIQSDEWAGLISPMIKDDRDKLFGMIAIANGLGWGRISVVQHPSRDFLELESHNGYEAYGHLKAFGKTSEAKCYMLAGIASGLMALIYERGDIGSRLGIYATSEHRCLCKGDESCNFRSHYGE